MRDSAGSQPGRSNDRPPKRLSWFRGKTAGRLSILAAAVMWSTNGLFVKSAVFADWPQDTRGTLLAFYRALFAGLLVLPAVRKPRFDVRLVPMALAFTAMNVAFLQSMTLTTAANAIWLQSTAPLWVFLFGLTLYRDPRDPRDLIPLVFGLAGAATILSFELRANSVDSRAGIGVLLGLLSGIFYAGVVVSIRRLRNEEGTFLVAVNHLAAAAFLAPYCLWLRQPVSAYQFVVLAAFGFFQMGVPYLLFARGLRDVSSQEGAAIALLEPVLVPIWVYLVPGGERPAPWTIAGAALILTGLVWRYRSASASGDASAAGQ
ncbi:MAG: EamA family transporter [Planctomycetia bacterium]|nr:EamA family transporter [Planctomycetia bacterium]